MKTWYCEYKNGIRIHDYFSFMINQFPILVIRKLDNPHSEDNYRLLVIGIFGFTWTFLKEHENYPE